MVRTIRKCNQDPQKLYCKAPHHRYLQMSWLCLCNLAYELNTRSSENLSLFSEVVSRRCLVKKVPLKFSKILLENTGAGVNL